MSGQVSGRVHHFLSGYSSGNHGITKRACSPAEKEPEAPTRIFPAPCLHFWESFFSLIVGGLLPTEKTACWPLAPSDTQALPSERMVAVEPALMSAFKDWEGLG